MIDFRTCDARYPWYGEPDGVDVEVLSGKDPS